MDHSLSLLGIDIGTTTSHCVLARADITTHPVFRSKRVLSNIKILYESPVSMTPFLANSLDVAAIEILLSSWLERVGATVSVIDNAGAIITGLASRAHNSDGLKKILSRKIPQAMVLTAEDPRLESFVSWHGSCGFLSESVPERYFLNIDMGGGTSNIALGKNGHVLATGSYFIGARHFLSENGKITPNSDYAKHLPKPSAESMEEYAARLASFYVSLLEDIVQGKAHCAIKPLTQATYDGQAKDIAVTFSGGVGELVYQRTNSDPFRYGDLGPFIAAAIRSSPFFAPLISTFEPLHKTRATVIGLGIHNTWVSGTSLHLPNNTLLPKPNIPIVARLSFSSSSETIEKVLRLTFLPFSAMQIEGAPKNYAHLLEFASHFKKLSHQHFVFILEKNLGKVFGGALSGWKESGTRCMVIDEVEAVPAHFVSIGKPVDNSVPLSFFGFY